MFTINEIADKYGVSHVAVRVWIKDGLKFDVEKIAGRKPRMILKEEDVIEYLKSKGEVAKRRYMRGVK